MASTARLDELKKKFDENPRRYFAPLANEHRKSGDLDQAIALCRTHLPQQPAHISGHIVLAQALFEAGSLDESRELFHTSLGLDPENLIALRYLGDIAREAEDVSTARSWYQRVLEVDPRNDEIVQLVRELDAPRPAAAIEAPPEPVADAAAPVAPSAPTPVPAEEDPRFAPLSLEHIDFDGPAPGAPSYATTDPAASESAPDESFDVHAAWTPDAPNVELPMLDEPELDPFDLHPSASAESLFDANAGAPPEDIFMTELADLSSPEADVSQVDPEYSVGDAWAAAPEAQPAAASPAEEAPTAIVEAESTAFEEGAFYVEPIAETPVEASVPDQATIDASTAETALWELPEAPQASATTDVPEAAAAEPELADASAFDVLDAAEPNAQEAPNAVAEVVESFADAPSAEWQTSAPAYDASPADASEQALGLEVMEFVPPPSDASATPVAEYTAAMDDRAEDSTAAEPSATPSAFVTETMAELYLQQGFRNEALAVYRELLSRSPDDSSLRDRIDQIERGSLSSIGSAAVSEDVVESALRRHSAKPARSVRSFFASLAGRRAPYQPQAESDGPAADVSAFAPVEHDSVAMGSDAAPEVQSWSNPEQISASEPTAESARITPLMSAAETLASYDPFADATDAPMTLPMDDSDALAAMPNVELPVLPVTPPVAPQSRVDDAPARRTLEDLFPDAPIAPRTEAAAETLATAFGRPEPQGRPTRAASSELSLDKVFRGSTDGAPPADGGFSFDQFFSDARPGGGDVAAPTMSPPETGRSGGAGGDAHDIEQFTAWLEGLKKK